MSRIEDLISQHCPDGVEFKTLGELCKIQTGPNINKALIAERPGPYPVINSGREPLGFVASFNVENDPIGIASRGSVGLVTWTPGRYFRGNLNYSCTVKGDGEIDARFLYHHLLHADSQVQALATHQGIPALNASSLRTLRVPVPPIEVQREIVRILDHFTALEAELEAELEARTRQYTHYRQELLDQLDAPRVNLASLGTWHGGMTPSKQNPVFWEGGDIPWLASMDVSDETTDEIRGRVTTRALKETPLKVVRAPSIPVVMRSNILRRTLPVGFVSVDMTVNQDIRALVVGDGIEARYVYQALRADSERIREQCVRTDGSMAAVDSKGFFSWEIPLPDLEQQRRIAAALNEFDTLVHNLNVGLPAELDARRKQYEYYRDKLLTFEEAVA